MRSRRVTTEGDELHYEVRGEGSPLLLIPGGDGDGGSYSLIADILSDQFKVITYDQRANVRSTMNFPQNFEISQQSRDAVAVLRAVGETSAFVFGILADLRGLCDRLHLRLNQVQHCVRISPGQDEFDRDCSGRLEKPGILQLP